MSQGKSKDTIFSLLTNGFLFILFLGYFINFRIYGQLNNLGWVNFSVTDEGIRNAIVGIVSMCGGKYFMIATVSVGLGLYALGQSLRTVDGELKKAGKYKIKLLLAFVLMAAMVAISPFMCVLFWGLNEYSTGLFLVYTFCLFGGVITYLNSGSVIFRHTNDSNSVKEDPFGIKLRAFNQTTSLMKTAISVNISYTFLSSEHQLTQGWINIVNQFRGNQVIGVPGSGKSYAFFNPAIEQNVANGFSMALYDFKFPELTQHAITCMRLNAKKIIAKRGKLPDIKCVYFDNILYSERVNVLQPHLLKDFTLDAVNLSKVFMLALNPSWKTKEGDFFLESAVSLTACAIWALKIYKGGKNCSLPHVIELLSKGMESVMTLLLTMKDNSLGVVMQGFKDSFEKGAFEQLSAQFASVTIPLSRFSSPKVYWVLTTEESDPVVRLDVNSKEAYQILALGNSSERKDVNNIFFSIFIVQIFRLINYKGRLPLAIILDESSTLSFPKGTLDTLIATGRSNLIAVWLGYQDVSQLHRDMGKEVGDSLFKMVGNTFSGSVNDETAEKIEGRLGKVQVTKKNKSVSPDGEISYSYSTQEDLAVPRSFFSTMSQGVFAGIVADNFGEEIDIKQFYGKVNYTLPYDKPDLLEITTYWKKKFNEHTIDYRHFKPVVDSVLEGTEEWKKADALVNKMCEENYKRVVTDIEDMIKDVLPEPEPEPVIQKR